MIKKNQFIGISLWGFKDTYVIDLTENTDDLLNNVFSFYLSKKATKVGNANLSFTRGRKFWTWFNLGSELWPCHSIDIQLEKNKLTLIYIMQGGAWLRFPPSQFEKEVIELEKFLLKT